LPAILFIVAPVSLSIKKQLNIRRRFKAHIHSGL
jgi:hypothetical protein